MAATVQIISLHGATGSTETQIDGGTCRLKTADNDTADANNPITVPGAGTNYSYIKQIRFKCTVTPANALNNLKFYTDGANGFGTGVSLSGKSQSDTTGTATSGSSNTLTDSGQSWTTNQWQNFMVEITAGTGSGQKKTVASNTGTVLTISTTFSPSPDNTSVYSLFYIDPTAQTTTQVSGLTDVFTYTSGSPLSITGSLSNPSTGLFGDIILLQMGVASTASQGTTPSETGTFSFDES